MANQDPFQQRKQNPTHYLSGYPPVSVPSGSSMYPPASVPSGSSMYPPASVLSGSSMYPPVSYPSMPAAQSPVGHSYTALSNLSATFFPPAQSSGAAGVGATWKIPNQIQGLGLQPYQSAIPRENQILFTLDMDKKSVFYKYHDLSGAKPKIIYGEKTFRELGFLFSMPDRADAGLLQRIQEEVTQDIVTNYTSHLKAKGMSPQNYPNNNPQREQVLYCEDNVTQKICYKYWRIAGTHLELVEKQVNYAAIGFAYNTSLKHLPELLCCLEKRATQEAKLFRDLEEYKHTIATELNELAQQSSSGQSSVFSSFFRSPEEEQAKKTAKSSAVQKLLAYLSGAGNHQSFSEEEKKAFQDSRLHKLGDRAKELYPQLVQMLAVSSVPEYR